MYDYSERGRILSSQIALDALRDAVDVLERVHADDLLLVVIRVRHALEIPRVLLARFKDGDVLALVGDGQLNLAHSERRALAQRRQRRNLLPVKRGLRLLKEPGVTEAAASDHGKLFLYAL